MGDYAGIPWTDRLAARLGHHASSMLIGAIIAVVAIGLHPLPAPLTFTVPITLFGFVLISWMLMRQHDRRLCEQCASAIPLNPAADAARYQRRFWLAHTGAEPRFLVPYLAVLIGSNFATSPIGRIGWAIMQLTMIYLILAQVTHRRLQPWCPWCSGGGGGEDVPESPPVLPQDDHQHI